jgi:hypothetical protein
MLMKNRLIAASGLEMFSGALARSPEVFRHNQGFQHSTRFFTQEGHITPLIFPIQEHHIRNPLIFCTFNNGIPIAITLAACHM